MERNQEDHENTVGSNPTKEDFGKNNEFDSKKGRSRREFIKEI